MGVRRSEERLAEAAKLYYIDELNQEEVASALGTTRSNVSRMLQAARRQGIIKFHVTHRLTRQSSLERRLAETFGLSDAVVLAAEAGAGMLERTGELAARWLAEQVGDSQTIALSWGRTLKAMADQLEVDRAYDVTVTQIGGDLEADPRLSGHELVREVATRLGGQYGYLYMPGLVATVRTAEELLGSRAVAEQLERARKADIALVGVGVFTESVVAGMADRGLISPEERAELEALAPAGTIAGRFYNDEGEEVGPLRDRTIALELAELGRIPLVAGVAAGPQKARPLWAALRGGLLDVAVCDQSAAVAALHLQREAGS